MENDLRLSRTDTKDTKSKNSIVAGQLKKASSLVVSNKKPAQNNTTTSSFAKPAQGAIRPKQVKATQMVATSITMFEDETKEADILKEEILVDKIPTTKRNSTVYEFEDFNDESDASLDIENLVDKVPSVKEISVVEAPKEEEA